LSSIANKGWSPSAGWFTKGHQFFHTTRLGWLKANSGHHITNLHLAKVSTSWLANKAWSITPGQISSVGSAGRPG